MTGTTSARPPAMSDVAALAGVSHQTVSRVLNDHPSVRPDTRERVLRRRSPQLGYRRNSAARALVTRRSGVLGVVTPATALLRPDQHARSALEEAAREVGWYVVGRDDPRRSTASRCTPAVEHFLGPRRWTASRSSRRRPRSPQAIAAIDLPGPGRAHLVGVGPAGRDVPARRRRRPAARRAPRDPAPARPGPHRGPARGRPAGLVRRAGPARGLARDQRGPGRREHLEAAWRLARRRGYELGRGWRARGCRRRSSPRTTSSPSASCTPSGRPASGCPSDVALVGFDDEVGVRPLHAAADHGPPGLRRARRLAGLVAAGGDRGRSRRCTSASRRAGRPRELDPGPLA